MPVHIKDFSVETEAQGGSQSPGGAGTPGQQQTMQVQPRPQTAREISDLLKLAQGRACRLHAD